MNYYLYLGRLDTVAPGAVPELEPIGSFTSEFDPPLEARVKAAIFSAVEAVIAQTPENVIASGAPASYRPNKSTGRPPRMLLITTMDHSAEINTSIRLGGAYSSLELSHLLGYGYNRVTQIMASARLKRRKEIEGAETTEDRAKAEAYPATGEAKGVTFHYLDETPGLSNV